MKRLKFIDLNVGDVISFERILLDDDIQRFVKLSGDKNPLHIDKDYGEMSIFETILYMECYWQVFFLKLLVCTLEKILYI